MRKFDCKKLADSILDKVMVTPKSKSLAILYAGENPASESYMKGKLADAKTCGIHAFKIKCANEADMAEMVDALNEESGVGGIIIQLPLPDDWEEGAEDRLTMRVAKEKDVDGFRADSPFQPCTPEAVIRIMKAYYGENLSGSEALLIGKGKLVGRPLIGMLLDEGCTLTVAHSKTTNLDWMINEYHDFTICAAGVGNLVDLMDIRSGLVIDATIIRGPDGKLHGDCFNFWMNGRPRTFVTPVPGGVGLLTRAVLMEHMGKVQKGWNNHGND